MTVANCFDVSLHDDVLDLLRVCRSICICKYPNPYRDSSKLLWIFSQYNNMCSFTILFISYILNYATHNGPICFSHVPCIGVDNTIQPQG